MFCKYIYKNHPRKGEKCNKKCRDQFCGIHNFRCQQTRAKYLQQNYEKHKQIMRDSHYIKKYYKNTKYRQYYRLKHKLNLHPMNIDHMICHEFDLLSIVNKYFN